MNNPIESLISLVAPHKCLSCQEEGRILCLACAQTLVIRPPSRCYRCHQATSLYKVCGGCRKSSLLSNVWVAAEYEDIPKKLVYRLKFDRAKAAAEVISSLIDENLPQLPDGTIVTHVPTASKRIRARGYDQSRLIAVSLARRRKMEYRSLLVRHGSTRQVGSDRKTRSKQLKGAFSVKKNVNFSKILLIDDVLTTGATIEYAAKTLKQAGAVDVKAAVFTQPID